MFSLALGRRGVEREEGERERDREVITDVSYIIASKKKKMI